jgi:TonB family protein
MFSSTSAFRGRISAFPFLLAFVLAGPTMQAAMAAPPQGIQELSTKAAARLLIYVVKPVYPPIAKVNFVRGSVKLEIKVSAKGRVIEAHAIDGEPLLAAAALKAVRKWLYRPYRSPEGPAPFITYASVGFNLHTHHFRGLLPTNADKYLEKQVRHPEVISRPQEDTSPQSILVRVLVGIKGEVIDATAPKAREPEIELARKSLRHWKFRPARWGAIAVPWYLMVRVPIGPVSLNEVANSANR